MLALVGCSPLSELEHAFPSVSRELLGFLRPGTPNDTRSVALAATDELLRRLLRVGEHSGNIGPGTTVKSDRNKSITEVSSGGARQVRRSCLALAYCSWSKSLDDSRLR